MSDEKFARPAKGDARFSRRQAAHPRALAEHETTPGLKARPLHQADEHDRLHRRGEAGIDSFVQSMPDHGACRVGIRHRVSERPDVCNTRPWSMTLQVDLAPLGNRAGFFISGSARFWVRYRAAETLQRAKFLASGCDDYLSKPYRIAELLTLVRIYTGEAA